MGGSWVIHQQAPAGLFHVANDLITVLRAGLKFPIIAVILGLSGACATGETRTGETGPVENPALKDSWKFTETLPEEYRRGSFNIVGGKVFEITASGLSKAAMDPARAGARLGEGRRIIAIHGTMYDPEAPGLDNPHLTIFQVIRARLGDRAALTGIGWPSAPFSAENLGAAWGKGRLGWYGLAQENASDTAAPLAAILAQTRAPYDVICHSLGCDILRRLLREGRAHPRRVLMLAPDTDYADMARWSRETGTPVLQVSAARDGILGFGQYAKANRDHAPPRRDGPYRAILIDVDHYLPGQARFSADYLNARRYLDHMAVLEIPELWPHYLKFLGD